MTQGTAIIEILKELKHLNLNIRALTEVINEKENKNEEIREAFYYTDATGAPGYNESGRNLQADRRM